jgi:hypothetical protein
MFKQIHPIFTCVFFVNIPCLMLVDPQGNDLINRTTIKYSSLRETFFFIWFVRLLALRPLLAYCASLGCSEDDCGEQMECRLAGETEVLGENLPQRHFCPSQNPTCLGHYEEFCLLV